jgi:hypothetical protein
MVPSEACGDIRVQTKKAPQIDLVVPVMVHKYTSIFRTDGVHEKKFPYNNPSFTP